MKKILIFLCFLFLLLGLSLPAYAFGRSIVSIKFYSGGSNIQEYVAYQDQVVDMSSDRRWTIYCNGNEVRLSGDKMMEPISLISSIGVDAIICVPLSAIEGIPRA